MLVLGIYESMPSISTRHSILQKKIESIFFVMNICSWLSTGCCCSSSHLFCNRKVTTRAPSEFTVTKHFSLSYVHTLTTHENNGPSVYISASCILCDDCSWKLLNCTTWAIIDPWSYNMHGDQALNMYMCGLPPMVQWSHVILPQSIYFFFSHAPSCETSIHYWYFLSNNVANGRHSNWQHFLVLRSP